MVVDALICFSRDSMLCPESDKQREIVTTAAVYFLIDITQVFNVSKRRRWFKEAQGVIECPDG